MSAEITRERLDELVDIDPIRLRDEAFSLLAERDQLLASLVALVRKVNEDQVPAYYEHLVPADVLAEAFPEPAESSSPSEEQGEPA